MERILIKWLKRIILFFILYVALGCLIPFMFQKKTGEDFKKQWQPEDVYAPGVTGVDRAAIIESSMEALTSRIELIHQAQERIILSTFDIRPGQSVNDIFSAIQEAADRGVQVQVLVDGMYGTLNMHGEPEFYALGANPNIEFRFYNIPNLLLPWNINGRMHDKYLIIDDKLLLLGGRNTFDYFLGEYNLKSLSYDRDVLIYNTAAGTPGSGESAIAQVDEYFRNMWDSKYCKTVFSDPSHSMKKKIPASRQELKEHYKQLSTASPELTRTDIDYNARTVPTQKVTLLTNPTHTLGKEPWVWYQVQSLMRQAKQQVYIHTPYAVFSKDMYRDMTDIAKKQKNFTMLVNSTAVGDNVMASADYTLNRDNIVDTGVTLYEYYGDHSSHGKSILIDDDLSLIGSYNLDMRSTYVDTETMLAIHSKELNQQLKGHLDHLESDSIPIASGGTFLPHRPAPPKELSPGKKAFYGITSYLFQLIRYLI